MLVGVWLSSCLGIDDEINEEFGKEIEERGVDEEDDETMIKDAETSRMSMKKGLIGLTLDPSGVGKDCLSTSVIEVFLKSGFLHSDHAVERPKTPLPMIRMDDGIVSDAILDVIIGASSSMIRLVFCISFIYLDSQLTMACPAVETLRYRRIGRRLVAAFEGR